MEFKELDVDSAAILMSLTAISVKLLQNTSIHAHRDILVKNLL